MSNEPNQQGTPELQEQVKDLHELTVTNTEKPPTDEHGLPVPSGQVDDDKPEPGPMPVPAEPPANQ